MNITLTPELVGCLRALIPTEIARVERFRQAHGTSDHAKYLGQLEAIWLALSRAQVAA